MKTAGATGRLFAARDRPTFQRRPFCTICRFTLVFITFFLEFLSLRRTFGPLRLPGTKLRFSSIGGTDTRPRTGLLWQQAAQLYSDTTDAYILGVTVR